MPKKDICIVKPVKIAGSGADEKPIKGHELIDELYCNVFLAAPTRSGKSTVIAHLMKHTLNPDCTVIIICSTIHLDPTWKHIIRYLENKKIKVITYDSLIDNGVNVVEQLTAVLQSKAENKSQPDDDEESFQPTGTLILCDPVSTKDNTKKEKPREYKFRAPEYTLIMDDLDRKQLRDQSVVNLLKKSRHYHMRVLISSQALIHMQPDAFSQLYLLYVWKGFSREYIDKLHNRIDTSLDKDQFYEVYKTITSEKHAFLNINLKKSIIRKRFGTPIPVEKIFVEE